jgi:hypothetical protein
VTAVTAPCPQRPYNKSERPMMEGNLRLLVVVENFRLGLGGTSIVLGACLAPRNERGFRRVMLPC